jgi:uncharacterized protein YjdB
MNKRNIAKRLLAVGISVLMCTSIIPASAQSQDERVQKWASVLDKCIETEVQEAETLKAENQAKEAVDKASWEYENNNYLYLADTLPINDSIYGSFNSAKDLDCFKTEIDKPGILTFTCTSDEGTAEDFDFALVDERGNVLKFAEADEDLARTKSLEVNPALDPDYYIVVLPNSESVVKSTYKLDCEYEELENYVAIDDIQINKDEFVLKEGSTLELDYTLNPENATESVTFVSTDEDVATVDENGVVTGVSTGSCEIKMMNPRETVKSFAKVFVESDIEINSFEFGKERYMTQKGDQINLKTALGLPEDAYVHIAWDLNDDLGTINEDGIFYAENEGVAKVTATYGEDTAYAYLIVGRIERRVERRAILVGNADYPGKVNDLGGPAYDVERLETVFNKADFEDKGDFAEINTYADLDRAGLQQAIDDMKPLVGKEDITYFYYSGHGNTDGRTSSLCMMNDDVNVAELKEMLDELPGVKVVFLDSCFSGGFIGKADATDSQLEQFNDDVVEIFGSHSKSLLTEGPYKVLTASSKTETSIEFGGTPPYGIFTKLLTDSSGYEGNYPADANGDSAVTLRESYDHVYEAILSRSPNQHMQIFPEDSQFEWMRYEGVHTTYLDNISFAEGNKTIAVGENGELDLTFEPADASNKSVFYYSDDAEVVSVDLEGNYTALKAGETTLHAISVDGLYEAEMKIVVE